MTRDAIERQLDREADILQDQLSSGEIPLDVYNIAMGAIEREARDAAQEEAEEAYHDALEGW